MRLPTLIIGLLCVGPAAPAGTGGAVAAQQPDPLAVQTLFDVQAALLELGPTAGPAIWPGFRPDTIPVLFVFPDRGTALINWRGALPAGFTRARAYPEMGWQPAADANAASTATTLDGRHAAQVVVHDLDRMTLLGLTAHETFHVFQQVAARADGRFGTRENSFLVSQYPVFSLENETDMALEGALLRDALLSTTVQDRRDVIHELLAVREARQRRLGPDLSEFERAAELNEGLAEYALIRVRGAAAARGLWDTDPHDETTNLAQRLASLTARPERSARLRFYATGAALALLLDAVQAGRDWKADLITEDRTLQDQLAVASGYRERERDLRGRAATRLGRDTLLARATTAIGDLRSQRAAQIDSILSAPGVRLALDASPVGFLGLCGFDPQNLLQAGDDVLLHTRWLRPCVSGVLEGEFFTPVVHDRRGVSLTAIIGAPDSVTLRIGDTLIAWEDGDVIEEVHDLRIDSPGARLSVTRARLERVGRTVTVRLLRD